MIKKNIALYFNLNYYCNNNCIFCASSNSKLNDRRLAESIYLKDFNKILKFANGYKISNIVINGGEPTLNKDLIKIIKSINRSGINCTLFTNGRSFSDYKYLNLLMKYFKGTFSIPLYGYRPSMHDYFTKTKNSFKETIEGLLNYFKIKARYDYPINLELKLLCLRPLLKENISICKYILNNFPNTNFISLNHLICSYKVKDNNCLIPKKKQLSISINDFLEFVENDYGNDAHKIIVGSMPACLIKSKNRCFMKKQSIYDEETYYFDPFQYSIIKYEHIHSYKPICKYCGLRYSSSDMATVECPYK